MVSAQAHIRIERPAAEVFTYFADLSNEPQWNHGHVRDVQQTSSGPVRLGTTFEGLHPGFGKATWRLSAYDPPTHIVIEGFTGGAPYRYVGDLEPQDGATLFHGRIEWEPRGAWRVLGPLLPWILKLQAQRSFRRLREALQQTAPPG